MYENVVRHWATASNVSVVFAENSGADMASIEAKVPVWRRSRFEFLRVIKEKERLPFRARPDVGRFEAQSIVYALNNSRLLATRCPDDAIFGITGRYFVHDFERLVNHKCLRGRGRIVEGDDTSRPLPWVYVQKPEWLERTGNERETSVLGFAASFAASVHGWAVQPVVNMTYDRYTKVAISSEVHLGKLYHHMNSDRTSKSRVCDLPPLPVLPTREGSTGKWRVSI